MWKVLLFLVTLKAFPDLSFLPLTNDGGITIDISNTTIFLFISPICTLQITIRPYIKTNYWWFYKPYNYQSSQHLQLIYILSDTLLIHDWLCYSIIFSSLLCLVQFRYSYPLRVYKPVLISIGFPETSTFFYYHPYLFYTLYHLRDLLGTSSPLCFRYVPAQLLTQRLNRGL
jgi:hypothetical protein